MGVNASFGVTFRFPVPEETLKQVVSTLNERLKTDITPEHVSSSSGTSYPLLRIERGVEPTQVRLATLQRSFDPYVLGGYWPYIRAIGEWLVDNLGEMGDVSYGYDAQDIEGHEPWEKCREENDRAYRLSIDAYWTPSEKDKHP